MAVGVLAGWSLIARSSADVPTKAGDVNEARVLAEASHGTNWMVDGGDFGDQHFSALKQITDKNIGKLGLAWWLDIDSPDGHGRRADGCRRHESIVAGLALAAYTPWTPLRPIAVEVRSSDPLERHAPRIRHPRPHQSGRGGVGGKGVSWAPEIAV